MISQIVSPLQNTHWDELALGMSDYTFFHSSCWAKTLAEAYRYTPFYFVLTAGGKPSAALACMEVSSVLTGRRGVCLPFSDYCPPLSTDQRQIPALFHEVFQWGIGRGWKYMEWRTGGSILGGQILYQAYLGHRLSLGRTEDELSGMLRDSTKRNMQKAVREGVRILVLHSEEAMHAFYRLNCMTRRDHGLPPQPKSFFGKVYKHVIAPKNGCVILAVWENKPIAASIYVHFGDKATFKYGASDKRFHYLRANNLVMYEAIRLYAGQGYQTLDLGRTDLQNKGLLQFKRGWGGVEYPIHYYRYNLEAGSFEKEVRDLSKHKPLVRKLPIPVLELAGKILYRHMG